MVKGKSAARATLYGFPLSSASSCASSSKFFSIKSASLNIKLPRCDAVILRHGPFSNAARAAATALSTSAASASAIRASSSPVEGLMDGNVFPEALFTHCPLIRSLVAPILTFGSITVVAVAIFNLLLCLMNSTLRWLVSLGKPNPPVAEYHLAIARQPFAPRMSRRKEAYTPARVEASPLGKNVVRGQLIAIRKRGSVSG